MSEQWVMDNLALVWKTMGRLSKAPKPLPAKHVEHYHGLVMAIRPYWELDNGSPEATTGEAEEEYYDRTWPADPCHKCGGPGFHPPCRLPYPGAGSYAQVGRALRGVRQDD